MRRPLVLLAAAGAAVALPTAAASALWSGAASGPAHIGADTMANVSGFTAACTTNKNKSTVDLAWTASPDAYVTGYTIVRTNTATGASAPVAVPSGRGTVSVVDTAPTNAGDAYTYTIRAVAAGTSWTTPLLTATGVPTYTKNACTTA